jgi:hypothetical protein
MRMIHTKKGASRSIQRTDLTNWIIQFLSVVFNMSNVGKRQIIYDSGLRSKSRHTPSKGHARSKMQVNAQSTNVLSHIFF